MKRLKYYMLHLDNATETFHSIYNGETYVYPSNYPQEEPYKDSDPTYYLDNISLDISFTNKFSQAKPTLTWKIPMEKLGLKDSSFVSADYCLRAFAPYIDKLNMELHNKKRPDEENGKYYLYHPGGEILVRNAAWFALCPQKDYRNGTKNTIWKFDESVCGEQKLCLCIRMQLQFPKRNIRKATQMLCGDLPDAVDQFVHEFDPAGLADAVRLFEQQSAIRAWLRQSDYCAFIANGSILPRANGTDQPMKTAIPFHSTPADEIEICGVRGMGIRRGITVITGGGYSGKSTLLDAISAGIYNHVLGDGRELCITDDSAVTISAEDGRSVKHVNISPFIQWLLGKDTADFSTSHASGSTSQAANIMEAVDGGARLLLIDEDRSATNFMIRDRMMKQLIEKEPIIPFTDRVVELYHTRKVSTILVIGGSGEYLFPADRIYMMEEYQIHDVTEKAKAIYLSQGAAPEPLMPADWSQGRVLSSQGFTSYPEDSSSERLAVSDMGFILIGDERIDVRGLHDIISPRQLDALGFMLRYLEVRNADETIDIVKRVDELYQRIEAEGLDFLYSSYFTTCERFLDLPRRQELLALINRMRNIHYAPATAVPE